VSEQPPPTPLAQHQNAIYLGGLFDRLPRLPIDIEALHGAFVAAQTAGPRGYVDGGAGTEATMRANRDALDRRQLVPRMLRDVSTRDLRREILGAEWPAPIGLAPIGVQSIVHPDGEIAVARAAAQVGVPLIASTASSYTIEDIAEASGAGLRWFQLYWPRDRELAASFLSRAEAAGYGALVVTLDTWLLGWRPRDLQHAYLPFLRATGIANYLSDPVFRAGLARPPEEDRMAAVGHFLGVFSDPSVGWDDLAFLRDATRLPILLKGIQHPDDARCAAAAGIDGVIVSNHGGRQLDGAIGSLDALERVVDADTGLEILFDSGVRSGADVAKALAVGARAALVGRPYMWALGVAGADGVAEFLRNLLAELDLTLALSGHAHVDELDRDCLAAPPAR
jgi:isopentenyl diphosphate isomerase/L-lactate dehydrogenase-like FMN-dependent dehydrogenase